MDGNIEKEAEFISPSIIELVNKPAICPYQKGSANDKISRIEYVVSRKGCAWLLGVDGLYLRRDPLVMNGTGLCRLGMWSLVDVCHLSEAQHAQLWPDGRDSPVNSAS
jgi:hypothetical protein